MNAINHPTVGTKAARASHTVAKTKPRAVDALHKLVVAYEAAEAEFNHRAAGLDDDASDRLREALLDPPFHAIQDTDAIATTREGAAAALRLAVKFGSHTYCDEFTNPLLTGALAWLEQQGTEPAALAKSRASTGPCAGPMAVERDREACCTIERDKLASMEMGQLYDLREVLSVVNSSLLAFNCQPRFGRGATLNAAGEIIDRIQEFVTEYVCAIEDVARTAKPMTMAEIEQKALIVLSAEINAFDGFGSVVGLTATAARFADDYQRARDHEDLQALLAPADRSSSKAPPARAKHAVPA